MLQKTMSRLVLLAACLAASAGAYAADPTLPEVYAAAQAGHYSEAQGMMDQVLRDHPNSAKAHFVEAELLAKQGKEAGAQTELSTAQRLDPGQSFAQPAAIQELKTLIAAEHAPVRPGAAAPVRAPAGSHLPWGTLLIGAIVLAAILMFVRARSRRAYYDGPGSTGRYGPAGSPPPYYGGGGPGVGPAGGMAQGGIGSGILGGLATGAAVGAGVVAGEELMHHVLDGNSRDGSVRQVDSSADSDDKRSVGSQEASYDMGGNDFGVNDASSWDDSSDSSSGSDDWC